jgi:branched-subunit amino acid ABC-type transport system permease component
LYLAISLALFAVAPILFVIVGIYYIISRGNVEKTKKAKDIFFNVIKGIVIVLLSFIIVNTLFVIFSPKVPEVNFVTWNQISCSPESIPGSNVPWIKKGQ